MILPYSGELGLARKKVESSVHVGQPVIFVAGEGQVIEGWQNMKPRTDAVLKDEKLDAVQKAAMLEGLRRMESRQIFMVLTPGAAVRSPQQNTCPVRSRARGTREGAAATTVNPKLDGSLFAEPR